MLPRALGVLRLNCVLGISGRGVFALSSAALWTRRKETVRSYVSGAQRFSAAAFSVFTHSLQWG